MADLTESALFLDKIERTPIGSQFMVAGRVVIDAAGDFIRFSGFQHFEGCSLGTEDLSAPAKSKVVLNSNDGVEGSFEGAIFFFDVSDIISFHAWGR